MKRVLKACIIPFWLSLIRLQSFRCAYITISKLSDLWRKWVNAYCIPRMNPIYADTIFKRTFGTFHRWEREASPKNWWSAERRSISSVPFVINAYHSGSSSHSWFVNTSRTVSRSNGQVVPPSLIYRSMHSFPRTCPPWHRSLTAPSWSP